MTIEDLSRPDVTLFLDHEGVICQAALSHEFPGEGVAGWIGRAWADTVEPPSSEHLLRMVEDARHGGVSAFRRITQRFPSGRVLPIEYTTVRLGDRTGLLAVGRSLQIVSELQSRLVEAQQAIERDYWKLREIETRYRLLFRSSTDALLLLRADSLSVVELNPAAASALSLASQRPNALIGREFLPILQPGERDAFQSMLGRVAEQGSAPAIQLHLGLEHLAWTVRASLLASESGATFLLQISPLVAATVSGDRFDTMFLPDLLERLPDGFVVTDRAGLILHANRGSLDMMQMPTESSVVHETLGRWLGRPGADLTVLLANVQRLGAVRLFSTILHGELGTETDVEISAAGNLPDEPDYIGVMIRDVGRRLSPPHDGEGLGERLGALTGQIGRYTLRALVEEAVSVVERHYIEEALDVTGGNRTATAELLGLSRQSLYVKLNRYGLDADSAKPPTGNP